MPEPLWISTLKEIPKQLFKTGAGVAKSIVSSPIRVGASLADLPNQVRGKEPRQSFNVPILGEQKTYARQYVDRAPEIGGLAAGLEAGSQGILDVATLASLAKKAPHKIENKPQPAGVKIYRGEGSKNFDDVSKTKYPVTRVPTHKVIPWEEPTDLNRIKEFKTSIKTGKELDPILVYERGDGFFDLHDGHKRLIATKESGYRDILAYVLKKGERSILAIDEEGYPVYYNAAKKTIQEGKTNPGAAITGATALGALTGLAQPYKASYQRGPNMLDQAKPAGETFLGTNYDPYDPDQTREGGKGVGAAGIKMDENMVATSLKMDGKEGNLRLGTVIYSPTLQKVLLVADLKNKRYKGENHIDFATPGSGSRPDPMYNRKFDDIVILREGKGREDVRNFVNSGEWRKLQLEYNKPGKMFKTEKQPLFIKHGR